MFVWFIWCAGVGADAVAWNDLNNKEARLKLFKLKFKFDGNVTAVLGEDCGCGATLCDVFECWKFNIASIIRWFFSKIILNLINKYKKIIKQNYFTKCY